MKIKNGKSRIKKETYIFVLLLLINSILMISSSSGKEFKIMELGFSFFSFFQKGFSYTAGFFSETVGSITELRKIKTEYNKLLEKTFQYESMEKDYDDLKRENLELKKQLTLSSGMQFEKIPAMVIGNDPGVFYSTITINKGKNSGIEKDMIVVAFFDGFQGLVGKIVETSNSSAKVLPVYDKKFSAAARLQNLRYDGIVSGAGLIPSTVKMGYVNKNARDRVGYGDVVITSGINSLFPYGIYIGRVISVSAQEYETSLELDVEPVVDFSRLEYVFVLKTNERESSSQVTQQAEEQ